MPNPSAEQSYRTLLIIWAALLFSQLMFVVLIWFSRPELFKFDFSQPLLGDNAVIVGLFAMLSFSDIVISLILRKKTLERSVAEQSIPLVQTAMIIGCALSEAISLFGVMLAFAFNYQYFFLFSILGVIGILLHFPRRSDVHAASYRQ
jgi:F0F1-type ATP synthase membrane subunit c/vacuolar-type H+-ATPase subunit K